MKFPRLYAVYLFLLCIFYCTSICLAQKVEYSFSQKESLSYDFSISGDIEYSTAGVTTQNFRVETKGLLKFQLLEEKDKSYKIKLVPARTFIKLDEMVLEDMTRDETAVSQLISTSIMEMGKNGRIISLREATSGMINMSQIIRLMPAFPDKIQPGKRWKQSLSSFNLPGIPMCNLIFDYLYTKDNDNPAKIKIVANQPIKEKKSEGDMTVNFTGRNATKGEFVFDNEKSEIVSFSGKFGLLLNVIFSAPPGPEKEISTKQSMPVNMDIKLNINLKRK